MMNRFGYMTQHIAGPPTLQLPTSPEVRDVDRKPPLFHEQRGRRGCVLPWAVLPMAMPPSAQTRMIGCVVLSSARAHLSLEDGLSGTDHRQWREMITREGKHAAREPVAPFLADHRSKGRTQGAADGRPVSRNSLRPLRTRLSS